MIKVVNLIIRLLSTVNLRKRKQISYEPDVARSIYILEKNCKSDGGHSVYISKWKCESDDPNPVYNFFPKCKLNEVSSDSYFHLKMWTGWLWSSLQFFFKM